MENIYLNIYIWKRAQRVLWEEPKEQICSQHHGFLFRIEYSLPVAKKCLSVVCSSVGPAGGDAFVGLYKAVKEQRDIALASG